MAEIRDTDRIALNRDLRRRLDEMLEPEGACLLARWNSIQVEQRGGRPGDRRFYASTSRVAWALANPKDHLSVDDHAGHTCENTGRSQTRLCCNSAHLVKVTLTEERKKPCRSQV